MNPENDFDNLVSSLDRKATFGCAVGVCFVDGNPERSHFTYDGEFLARYQEENLSLDDHTLKVGFASDGVFLWSELETIYGPSRAMEVAREFGVVDGLCFSTTVNGYKSIASVAVGDAKVLGEIKKDQVMRYLDIATLYMSRQLDILGVPVKIKEILQQASRGASLGEISENLSLSVSGVRNRQRAAVSYFSASNLTEAVYVASKRGVI